MDQTAVQGVLHRRLEAVDQELADLRSLLAIMHRLERDAALRARLREAQLPFRLQDLGSGGLTGARLRQALDQLEGLAAAT